jgi:hypothetical protein
MQYFARHIEAALNKIEKRKRKRKRKTGEKNKKRKLNRLKMCNLSSKVTIE